MYSAPRLAGTQTTRSLGLIEPFEMYSSISKVAPQLKDNFWRCEQHEYPRKNPNWKFALLFQHGFQNRHLVEHNSINNCIVFAPQVYKVCTLVVQNLVVVE